MRRKVPNFFLKNPSHSSVRNFSDTALCELKTFVWLPAIKIRDKVTREIISREVLSPVEAKQQYAQNVKGLDPWGHAAAQIIVDSTDGRSEVVEKIQELAVVNKVVSLRDASSIQAFQAYLSVYPDHTKPLRQRRFTASEQQEWTERTMTENTKANEGKALSLPLFSTEYAALNSSYKQDVIGYGRPESTEKFSRGLDFLNIVDTCFKIMSPVLRGNTIVLETALPSASYFGKAMLDEHRVMIRMLADAGEKIPSLDTNNVTIHVCTTANLVLFKAGLGEDQYYQLAKQVLKDNPKLMHGFPITHFADAFFKALSQHPDYKAVSVINDAPDSTNHGNKI